MQKISKKKIVIPAVIGVLLLITVLWYVNDYYHSDESVQEYLKNNDKISIIEIQDGLYLDVRTKEEYDSGHIKNALCHPIF